jgi:translation initiation factor IF-1
MARDDLAKVEGVVSDVLSGDLFAVTLKGGKVVQAKLSGRLRKLRIRVIAGDQVTVGMSPYDLTHGLIVGRQRLNNPRVGS